MPSRTAWCMQEGIPGVRFDDAIDQAKPLTATQWAEMFAEFSNCSINQASVIPCLIRSFLFCASKHLCYPIWDFFLVRMDKRTKLLRRQTIHIAENALHLVFPSVRIILSFFSKSATYQTLSYVPLTSPITETSQSTPARRLELKSKSSHVKQFAPSIVSIQCIAGNYRSGRQLLLQPSNEPQEMWFIMQCQCTIDQSPLSIGLAEHRRKCFSPVPNLESNP